MGDGCRNLYYNARHTAGLTQERWAEVLGISPESVRQYESGRAIPGDEIALRMAEVAGQQIVCYWHLLHKYRVAGLLLPEVEQVQLPTAVLSLLLQIKALQDTGRQVCL